MADRAFLEHLMRRATDEGRLVEVGWLSMRLAILPANAGKVQLEEMRKAYYFGAQHLFACMTRIVSDGEEITDADMRRMASINDELNAFLATVKGQAT